MTTEPTQIGNATLYHADCREVLPRLDAVDALIADPQYGIDLAKLTGSSRERWSQGRRTNRYSYAIHGDRDPFDPAHLLHYPKAVIWGGNHFCSRLPDGPDHRCWLIWDKRDGSTSDNQADCEMAWTNLAGPARLYSHKWRGMCRAGEENLSRGGRRVHPAQKPVALMMWVIEQCRLAPGSIILDPYMGSGSTGVAAVRMGFRYIGIEIERPHFDTACHRIAEEQQQGRLFG